MNYGVLGISGFFPMWMSNTTTAAMMVAIIAPVIDNLKDSSRFSIRLILAVPFGASVGGIGTPIGTPPNAVALAALRQAGYGIGFLNWMMVAVPLAVLLMALIGLLLYFFLPAGCGSGFRRDRRARRYHRPWGSDHAHPRRLCSPVADRGVARNLGGGRGDAGRGGAHGAESSGSTTSIPSTGTFSSCCGGGSPSATR